MCSCVCVCACVWVSDWLAISAVHDDFLSLYLVCIKLISDNASASRKRNDENTPIIMWNWYTVVGAQRNCEQRLMKELCRLGRIINTLLKQRHSSRSLLYTLLCTEARLRMHMYFVQSTVRRDTVDALTTSAVVLPLPPPLPIHSNSPRYVHVCSNIITIFGTHELRR